MLNGLAVVSFIHFLLLSSFWSVVRGDFMTVLAGAKWLGVSRSCITEVRWKDSESTAKILTPALCWNGTNTRIRATNDNPPTTTAAVCLIVIICLRYGCVRAFKNDRQMRHETEKKTCFLWHNMLACTPLWWTPQLLELGGFCHSRINMRAHGICGSARAWAGVCAGARTKVNRKMTQTWLFYKTTLRFSDWIIEVVISIYVHEFCRVLAKSWIFTKGCSESEPTRLSTQNGQTL